MDHLEHPADGKSLESRRLPDRSRRIFSWIRNLSKASILAALGACTAPKEMEPQKDVEPQSIQSAFEAGRQELITESTTIRLEQRDRLDIEKEPIPQQWITLDVQKEIVGAFERIQVWSGADEPEVAARIAAVGNAYKFVFREDSGEWDGDPDKQDILGGGVQGDYICLAAPSVLEVAAPTLTHEFLHAFHNLEPEPYPGTDDASVNSLPLEEGAIELIVMNVAFNSGNFHPYRYQSLLAAALGPRFYKSLITNPDFFHKALSYNPPSPELISLVNDFAKQWNIKKAEDRRELYMIFVEGEMFNVGHLDSLTGEEAQNLIMSPEFEYATPFGKVNHLKVLLEKNGTRWEDFVKFVAEPLKIQDTSLWLNLDQLESFPVILDDGY